jgi:hypothetical protein
MADRKPAPTTICIRQFGGSCLSVGVQVLVAVVFIGVCVYAAAVALEAFEVVGISTIPPGLKYVPYRHEDGLIYRRQR